MIKFQSETRKLLRFIISPIIYLIREEIYFKLFVDDSPQNGMPSGVQLPFSQTRRAGPSNSKPRSHEYEATVL